MQCTPSLIPEYDADGINEGVISKDIEDLEINWAEIILRTEHSSRLPMPLPIPVVEYSVTEFLIRQWTNQWNSQLN